MKKSERVGWIMIIFLFSLASLFWMVDTTILSSILFVLAGLSGGYCGSRLQAIFIDDERRCKK